MKKQIKAVDARGRKLGGDTPLLCAPLVGRTRARLLAEATRVLKQKPDLVEWRVDFFDAIGDAGAVVEAARALREVVGKRPVVFTCRVESGGGERITLGREAIVALYDAVAASGLVDFVDFEMDNDPDHVRRVRETTRQHGVRLILSYHNLAYTPGLEYLIDRVLEAERLGADREQHLFGVVEIATLFAVVFENARFYDRIHGTTLLAEAAEDALGQINVVAGRATAAIIANG